MSEPSRIVPPNYTQIPNVVLDSMSEMSDSEFRVVLAVARQTFGWHRERDKISVSQLQKLTGLSRQGVVNGIKAGEQRGIIERIPDETDKRGGIWYRLLVNDVDQSTELTRTSQRTRPELVNDVDQSEGDLRQQEAVNGTPKEIERNIKETMRESNQHDRSDASLSQPKKDRTGESVDHPAVIVYQKAWPDLPLNKRQKELIAEFVGNDPVCIACWNEAVQDYELSANWKPGNVGNIRKRFDRLVQERRNQGNGVGGITNGRSPPTDNRPDLPAFQPQSLPRTNGAKLANAVDQVFGKRKNTDA